MTQQMRVSLNQWLLVVVSVAFGIWGGYSVLQYRVTKVEDNLEKACNEQKISSAHIAERVELGMERRIINEKNISVMQNDLETIKSGLKDNNADVKEIQHDIKKILIKIE